MGDRIVAIWSKSLTEAMSFINDEGLHNCFVQMVEDKEMKFAYWMIFKFNDNLLKALVSKHPRLTIRK